MFHRAGLANDSAASGADFITGAVNIVDANGNMAVAITQIVVLGVPIVSQLQRRLLALVGVAYESEGKPSCLRNNFMFKTCV